MTEKRPLTQVNSSFPGIEVAVENTTTHTVIRMNFVRI
jgi:hypothetical protein